MIEHIDLLKNIGQFDSVSPPQHLIITPFSLIYAENGRGKTTLAAILRSLATGDADLVNDRHRLGSQHPPHIIIDHGGQKFMFQDGGWDNTLPNIAIFDDAFVAENVCSGIHLDTSHRQSMHELILGAQGVSLNSELQTHVARIEQHNVDLREKGDAIPALARGLLSINVFCALTADPDIDAKIQDAERRLAAARASDAIRQRAGFLPLSLPDFDTGSIDAILNQTVEGLAADAAAHVKDHVSSLGSGGEAWVADGMPRIEATSAKKEDDTCPFCAQNLNGSEIISHYQAYFSDVYKALKAEIRRTGVAVRDTHAGEIPAAFERNIRNALQVREFWKDFSEIPEITTDTAAIVREWTAAREAVLEYLRKKAAAPLDHLHLSAEALQAVATFRIRIAEITTLSGSLLACNPHFEVVKEQANADNLSALTDDLNKLKSRKQRFSTAIMPLCDEYLLEKEAKQVTEKLRNLTRTKLDEYREAIFPLYENAINEYLGRFNASFRLGEVTSQNNRGGSSASYCIVINSQKVNITAEDGPSFHNTLSAGDRNTLALAFFFASLEQDPNLAQKIVIIDDPMTSLDEHRSLKTRQEMLRLYSKVSQMVVLSHSKPFLCALWNAADKNTRSSIRIGRAGDGSELDVWDVRNDSITENDKNCELISQHIRAGNPANERAVAQALRQVLEAFMRVAYPADFPPGKMLGGFIEDCRRRHGNGNEILSEPDTTELRALLDYANVFHHDTNPAYQTAAINDAELEDFSRRTLLFASRQ